MSIFFDTATNCHKKRHWLPVHSSIFNECQYQGKQFRFFLGWCASQEGQEIVSGRWLVKFFFSKTVDMIQAQFWLNTVDTHPLLSSTFFS